MKNLIEVYTNCYGEYGIKSAIEGISEVGLKNIELAIKPHGGILSVSEAVYFLSSFHPKKSIEEMIEEFEIKTLDEYLLRARKEREKYLLK